MVEKVLVLRIAPRRLMIAFQATRLARGARAIVGVNTSNEADCNAGNRIGTRPKLRFTEGSEKESFYQ